MVLTWGDFTLSMLKQKKSPLRLLSPLALRNQCTTRRALILILIVKLLIGVNYISRIPFWEGHEDDFYNVLRYTRVLQRLPTEADYPDGDADVRQATQPPLYFILSYPIVAVLDDNLPVPAGRHPLPVCTGGETLLSRDVTTRAFNWPPYGHAAAAYLLRFFSLLTSLGSVVFVYLTGREIFPKIPIIGLSAAALIAIEPYFMFINSTINNDNLLTLLSAANLYFAVRVLTASRFSWRTSLCMLITVMLAVLTKLSGWAIFGINFVTLAALLGIKLRKGVPRSQILFGLGILALIILVVGGVGLYNLNQFGSLFGRYRGLDAMVVRSLTDLELESISGTLQLTLQDTRVSYLEPFSPLFTGELSKSIYVGIPLFGLLGFVTFMVRAVIYQEGERLQVALLIAGVIVATLLLVVFRNHTQIIARNSGFASRMFVHSPLRYYAPAVPAIALALSIGLHSLWPKARLQSTFAPFSILLAVIWLGITVLRINNYAPYQKMSQAIISPETFASYQGVHTLEGPQSENWPQLIGYEAVAHSSAGVIDLILYLSAETPLTTNYIGQLHVDDAEGNRITCQFVPLQGLYPTTRWEPDEVIVQRISLPNCSRAIAPLDLSLDWIAASQDGSVSMQPVPAPSLSLGTFDSDLARASTCPANLGVIADELQIIKFNGPTEVTRGEVYVPSVNWLVLNPPTNSVIRVYVLRHLDSGTEYQCVGRPHQGSTSFAQWEKGNIYYFDECAFSIPEHAPSGTYRLLVGTRGINGNDQLPAHDNTGRAIPDGLIPLGNVVIQAE